MIDINTLRQLALDGDLAAMQEIVSRFEAAEKERNELLASIDEWLNKTKWVQQGINEGTISAKYIGLHRADVMASLLGKAEKERDKLRARIEQTEKQEPVALVKWQVGGLAVHIIGDAKAGDLLCALPGAKGEEK